MVDRDWLEEWRPTPEAPGYEVSSWGRARKADGSPVRVVQGSNGYKIISVKLNGKWTSRQLGACVCAAFHGPRPPNCDADHKDRNRANNQQWNLQWLPEKLNRQIAIHKRGEDRFSAKLTASQVDEIRRLYKRHDRSGRYSGRALAAKYGVATPTIMSIINGVTWNEARSAAIASRREELQ